MAERSLSIISGLDICYLRHWYIIIIIIILYIVLWATSQEVKVFQTP